MDIPEGRHHEVNRLGAAAPFAGPQALAYLR